MNMMFSQISSDIQISNFYEYTSSILSSVIVVLYMNICISSHDQEPLSYGDILDGETTHSFIAKSQEESICVAEGKLLRGNTPQRIMNYIIYYVHIYDIYIYWYHVYMYIYPICIYLFYIYIFCTVLYNVYIYITMYKYICIYNNIYI